MRNSAKLMVVVAASLALGACSPSEEASTQPPGSGNNNTVSQAAPPAPPSDTVTALPGGTTGPECTVDQIEVSGEPGKAPVVKLPQDCSAPTKLLTKDLEPGQGAEAKAGSKLEANYVLVGWSNGQTLDSSYTRGKPLPLTLGQRQVIQGWDEGLQGMFQGGRRVVVVPPALGYGSSPGHQLEKETLIFVVDAVKVTAAAS